MNRNARNFTQLMESKSLKYQIVREDDKKTVVRCGINAKNTTLSILFDFPDSGHYVSLSCFDFVKIPENKIGAAMIACNSLNKQYKWVKFYVDDSDNTVTIEDDAIIEGESGAEECFELLVRMMNIADDAYPVFMKAIYA